MQTRIICQNAECRQWVELEDVPAKCPGCGQAHRLSAHQSGQVLEHCLSCGSDELYIRKDFPQRIGLIMVVIVAIVSIYLFAIGALLWSLGVLLALVVVDLLIYGFVPRMTVCYRCRAEYRQYSINPRHRGFDLATAEQYHHGDKEETRN